MMEKDFENKKNLLLGKLPDYLQAKGIDHSHGFVCLNPVDNNQQDTMFYDPKTQTVKCIHCNASYTIFDLIGMDFSLATFSQRFAKAYELYIGKLPIGYIEILDKIDNSNNYSRNSQTIHTLKKEGPIFELDAERETTKPNMNGFVPFGQDSILQNDLSRSQFVENRGKPISVEPFGGDLSNEKNQQVQAYSKNFNSLSPFDEAKLHTFNVKDKLNQFSTVNNNQANSFQGFANNQSANDALSQNSNNEPQNLRFGEKDGVSFQNISKRDLALYIGKCAMQSGRTDYFKLRGLSDEIITKFKLGFDDGVSADAEGKGNNESVAVIPYSNVGYCLRKTHCDVQDKHRYIKHGVCGIYNEDSLNSNDGPIFITEGEFDTLSLESLGYSSVSLGGVGNIMRFMECLKNCSKKHVFYICFDNDKVGKESAQKLNMQMSSSKYECQIANLSFPYKDVNEILCKDKKLLQDRLQNLRKILSIQPCPVGNDDRAFKIISSQKDLYTLDVSENAYSLSGNPRYLRMLVAKIISNNENKPCLYLATNFQKLALTHELYTYNKEVFLEGKFNNVHMLTYDFHDSEKDIANILDALIIQGFDKACVFIDLTVLSKYEALAVARKSSEFLLHKSTVIFLCNHDVENIIEGVCVQNIPVYMNEIGQVNFKVDNVL